MIDCTITSPLKTMVYKNIRNITLPAISGKMQILPGHAESFVLLRKGEISLLLLNGNKETIQNMEGECHIKDDVVTVLL